MDFSGTEQTPESFGQPRHGPRLFLDSADPTDWDNYLPLGIFYGVTTNPLLLERAGQPCNLANLEELSRRALDLGARQIHLQTWGQSPGEMVRHGRQLARLAKLGIDVAVKVPGTEAGLRAAADLASAGCTITLTAIYSPGQVLAAAGFGATYAAPYLGRLNDAGRDGRTAILEMRDILRSTGSQMRLLVASLRRPDQIVDLARQGLDTFTFAAPVAAQLIEEPLTVAAAADFQRAAEAMGGTATDGS